MPARNLADTNFEGPFYFLVCSGSSFREVKKLRVTKAVIPAAGLGTRVLPITKSVPKEMLPIVDKPAIQYIVEEAVNSGITDILIVTSRGKGMIEDYFDRCPEIESGLLRQGKVDLCDSIAKISGMANVYFVRQGEAKGLGHAVACAESFVGDDPFAVLYGDDVIVSEQPVCRQLMDAFNEYGLCVVGTKQVPAEEICRYGSLKVEHLRENVLKCTDMLEKPSPGEVMSTYSIFGRCILTPEIFGILDNIGLGVGGEIQLTDAMKVLARRKGIIAVDFEGKRYDIGNKLGIVEACVEVALNHPDVGADFRKYLQNLCADLL